MKKSANKFLAILGLTLAVSATSYAQSNNSEERPKGPPTFKQLLKDLDANEDGKISLEEAKGPLKEDFKKIDKDEDGFLSEEEIKNAPKPERKERPRD
ncbi:EF-hand domain-containing protein [Polaribacter sargassicola]|uniref:EF-hand domain-containing protein n=1 Tax=Polaribacter sargassicola TaxID=2836891 RepID=UPI001F292C9C|nr:EF-hand domain-containing protein [Polaribacter sp. DS7-9]MCG1035477.1 EF-hand domain-containing protein [Polaribacter sp. DS7-9]